MGSKRVNVGLIILVVVISIITSIGSIYVCNHFIDIKKDDEIKELKNGNESNKLEESNSSNVVKHTKGGNLYFKFDDLCLTDELTPSCNKTLKITDYNERSFDVVLKAISDESYSIQIGDFVYSYSVEKNGCGGIGSIDAFAFLSNGMLVIKENTGMCHTNKVIYYDSNYTFLKKFESQGDFDIRAMSNEYTECNVHEEIPGDVESQTLSGYRYDINEDGTFSNKKLYEYRTMCSSSAE